jgi:hypothetical protein
MLGSAKIKSPHFLFLGLSAQDAVESAKLDKKRTAT